MKSNVLNFFAVILIFGLVTVTGALAGDIDITGTVEKTDKGIVITADDGNVYDVMGADLSKMVGKAVKATGTLAEDDKGKVIMITTVEPAQK